MNSHSHQHTPRDFLLASAEICLCPFQQGTSLPSCPSAAIFNCQFNCSSPRQKSDCIYLSFHLEPTLLIPVTSFLSCVHACNVIIPFPFPSLVLPFIVRIPLGVRDQPEIVLIRGRANFQKLRIDMSIILRRYVSAKVSFHFHHVLEQLPIHRRIHGINWVCCLFSAGG